jgi:hypothetical protein
MQETVSQALYSYWNGLRAGRMAPKRFEIEPSCIAGNLPDTFILERVSQATLRFRLAGTRVSETFGIDFRGINLFQLFDEADGKILERQIQLSVSKGAVSVFRIRASSETELSNDFEMLVLPLSHTRDSIDRFLGSVAPVGKPHWLGTVALTRRKLAGHETIWPDGAPADLSGPAHMLEPLLPVVREARIVRSDRRQFRVYEGGLGRPSNG